MCYLNGWHPFESIRFDLVEINMWRCLVLQIWEQQKQLLRKQRVIQLYLVQIGAVNGSHRLQHKSVYQRLVASRYGVVRVSTKD